MLRYEDVHSGDQQFPVECGVTVKLKNVGIPHSGSTLFNNALNYVNLVRAKLADQPGAFIHFMETFNQYQMKKIDRPTVIKRIIQIFDKQRELITGFNMFLPSGYKIELHHDDWGLLVPVVCIPPAEAGGILKYK